MLQRHCPSLNPKDLNSISATADRAWEWYFLQRAVAQEQVTPSQIKAILKDNLEEVLFPLINSSPLTIGWRPTEAFTVSTYLSLSAEDIRQSFRSTYQNYNQLQQMGLSYLFPEMAPVVKSPALQERFATESSLNLVAFLDGQSTIWDLVVTTRQPLAVVNRLLHYLVQQGVVKLETIPDLTAPQFAAAPLEPEAVVEPAYQPLIACIDDSPTIGKVLEEFLSSSGYRLLYIQNPMQGIATLTQDKPDLIFLDLVMPDTNGYNLCQFLRNSIAFKDVPIIIMTSWDGVINRTRAKLVGAKDFLGKPFSQEDVIKMIQKYLPKS
jgi:chemotaxis family two-component system response regulator PixG